MSNYLISRLLIVFLIKFFSSWAFNAYDQFKQFFGIDSFDNVWVKELPSLVMVLVIGLGTISINLIFTFLHLAYNYGYSELIKAISNKGIKSCIIHFFRNFWQIFNENFNHQEELERYPRIFLIMALFFVSFIKGNPLLNNYYGIYKEYEVENTTKSGETTNYEEEQMFIIPKERNDINLTMDLIRGSYEDDEPNFYVKKRGYLFLQAGLIDGFQTYDGNYKGISSYVECLFFSVLEKLINSMMYFLIPFLIAVSIHHYKFKG